MSFAVYLGRAVQAIRHERGLKRRELVAASGVSMPFLCEIENGSGKYPSMPNLLRLADALEVPASALLARAEYIQAEFSVPLADVMPGAEPEPEPLNYSALDRSCDAYYGMGT